jgi:hypothetical protein
MAIARKSSPSPSADNSGDRAPYEGTYGYAVPVDAATEDPSRGAALERDRMDPDADFSRRPDGAVPPAQEHGAPPQPGEGDGIARSTPREQRIREAAYARS